MVVLCQFREERLFVAKIGMLCFLVYPFDIGSAVPVKVVTVCNVHIVLG